MQFLKVTLLLFLGLSILSCNKNDEETPVTPVEAYDVQYKKDLDSIEKFLDNYKLVLGDSLKIDFVKLPVAGSDDCIRKSFATQLKSKKVTSNNVDYKVYYLDLNRGIESLDLNNNPNGDYRPSNSDAVLVEYKGLLLKHISTYDDKSTFESNQTFDYNFNPIWFNLSSVVAGWREIMPLFNRGAISVPNQNNVISYINSGNGIMFVPSGLAYYNQSTGKIPAYAPLIFSFKLRYIRRNDDDFDGYESKSEEYKYENDTDLGIMIWKSKKVDTDGDSYYNYLDQDDDGDGILSKDEKKEDTDGDGKLNYLDADDDGDGKLTKDEKSGDCDNDLKPNYLDDSDGC